MQRGRRQSQETAVEVEEFIHLSPYHSSLELGVARSNKDGSAATRGGVSHSAGQWAGPPEMTSQCKMASHTHRHRGLRWAPVVRSSRRTISDIHRCTYFCRSRIPNFSASRRGGRHHNMQPANSIIRRIPGIHVSLHRQEFQVSYWCYRQNNIIIYRLYSILYSFAGFK